MTLFIRVLSPAISFLSWSADRILALLPVRSAPAMTSIEDIIAFVDEGGRSGALNREESHMMGNVLRRVDQVLASRVAEPPPADVP